MPKVIDPHKQSSTNNSSNESRVVVDKVVGHLKEMRKIESDMQSVLAASRNRLMAFALDESDDSSTEKQSTSEDESLTSFSAR